LDLKKDLGRLRDYSTSSKESLDAQIELVASQVNCGRLMSRQD